MDKSRLGTWALMGVVGLLLQLPGCWCEPSRPEVFNTFPGPGADSADAFCAQWGEGECAYANRCTPAEQAGLEAAGGCASRMKARCLAHYAPLIAALPHGRATFDPYHAKGCVDGLGSRACDAEPSQSCSLVMVGAVPGDGPCGNDVECASGLFCSGGPLSCGLCTAQAGVDGPCWSNASCQKGHLCVEGTCKAELVVGANCFATPTLCPAGSFCPPLPAMFAALAVCTEPAPQGSSCAPGLLGPTNCASGLTCLGSDAGQFCVGPAPLGGACDSLGRTAPGCQAAGVRTYCDATSRTCQTVRVVGSGEACGGSALCRSNLQCVSGTCQSRPVAGDACTVTASVDPCFESTCTAGRCVGAARPGDGCDAGCPGLTCAQGACGAEACDGGEAWDAGPKRMVFPDGGLPGDGGFPPVGDGGFPFPRG